MYIYIYIYIDCCNVFIFTIYSLLIDKIPFSSIFILFYKTTYISAYLSYCIKLFLSPSRLFLSNVFRSFPPSSLPSCLPSPLPLAPFPKTTLDKAIANLNNKRFASVQFLTFFVLFHHHLFHLSILPSFHQKSGVSKSVTSTPTFVGKASGKIFGEDTFESASSPPIGNRQRSRFAANPNPNPMSPQCPYIAEEKV
jgi:hypothetical protein